MSEQTTQSNIKTLILDLSDKGNVKYYQQTSPQKGTFLENPLTLAEMLFQLPETSLYSRFMIELGGHNYSDLLSFFNEMASLYTTAKEGGELPETLEALGFEFRVEGFMQTYASRPDIAPYKTVKLQLFLSEYNLSGGLTIKIKFKPKKRLMIYFWWEEVTEYHTLDPKMADGERALFSGDLTVTSLETFEYQGDEKLRVTLRDDNNKMQATLVFWSETPRIAIGDVITFENATLQLDALFGFKLALSDTSNFTINI